MNTVSKPAWSRLYTQGAIGVAILFLIPLLNLSETMQKVVFSLVTFILCASVKYWISVNSAALEAESASIEELHQGRYYTLHPAAASDDPSDTLTNGNEKEAA